MMEEPDLRSLKKGSDRTRQRAFLQLHKLATYLDVREHPANAKLLRMVADRFLDAKIPDGFALVPIEPTHAMERAYFTAELPPFNNGLSGTQRHKRNRMKMEARWKAMLAAALQAEGGS
jgi:hypothetical protein